MQPVTWEGPVEHLWSPGDGSRWSQPSMPGRPPCQEALEPLRGRVGGKRGPELRTLVARGSCRPTAPPPRGATTTANSASRPTWRGKGHRKAALASAAVLDASSARRYVDRAPVPSPLGRRGSGPLQRASVSVHHFNAHQVSCGSGARKHRPGECASSAHPAPHPPGPGPAGPGAPPSSAPAVPTAPAIPIS